MELVDRRAALQSVYHLLHRILVEGDLEMLDNPKGHTPMMLRYALLRLLKELYDTDPPP